MTQPANHSENRRYAIRTLLALSALLILLASTANVMGLQADAKKPSSTEQQDDGGELKEEKLPEFLKIGSPAPALDLDYWPTDNNGLLPPVKKFEPNRVYVINFFTVDNEYSVSNLKSMVALQKKHADDGVQIICISSSEREKTDEFLDGKVKKSDETYIDLLNPISSAVDSEQTATRDYLARSGILTAWTFVVGKTGKLEWLGRPTDVAKPLAKVVSGKWDRNAFAKKIEPKQEQQYRRATASRLFGEWMFKFSKDKNNQWDAESLLEHLAQGAKDPANKAFRTRIELTRVSMMLRAYANKIEIENLETDLAAAIRSFTKLSKDDLNSELNDTAWEVYEMYEAGLAEKESVVMEAAKEMAEKALKFRPESGAVNDTVAHFAYLVDGDIDRAIKLQELAVKNSGDTQADSLEEFLEFLKNEKSTGEKKSLQKNGDGEGSGDDSDF